MADIPVKTPQISRLEAIGFVWDVFASVAIPAVCFALLGRAIDARWGSFPYATVIGLLLSLIVAGFLVTRKATAMAKRMKGERV